MGVYPLRGEAVIHFGEDSREEAFIEFLKVLGEENPHYKAIVLPKVLVSEEELQDIGEHKGHIISAG